LLGLLNVAPRIQQEFNKETHWRRKVNLDLKIFLRSDIFAQVKAIAPEPDKIATSRLVWDDRDLLLRVIEERFVAASGQVPNVLWDRYFCPMMDGLPTRTYLAKAVLPRPRDLIVLVNAAVGSAVNHKHSRVEEGDIEAGERLYSQFAADSLLVENGVTVSEMEQIVFGFAGCAPVVKQSEVTRILSGVGIAPERQGQIIDHLCELSLLGLEIKKNQFSYAADEEDFKRLRGLAQKVAGRYRAEQRYEINRPFRRYLEVSEE
jgi:hypothetical protein